MVNQVVLVSPRGFCAGVDRAIKVVEIALERFGSPVYVKHQIVHNNFVVKKLEEKGAVFVEEISQIPPKSICIFSAHGISPAVRQEAKKRELNVIDATCPLVTKVHLEALRYAKEGNTIILVGHKNHVETIGTSGEVPEKTIVIETKEDVANLKVPDENKLVYLTQTTLSMDDTKEVIDTLKQRFPNIKSPPASDICYATQNRQNAIKELVKKVDLILVIGSKESSNSNRLVDVSKDNNTPAYLIDDASKIDNSWFDGVNTVGISSGASVPEELVQGVIKYFEELGVSNISTDTVIEENIEFTLPKEMR